jgi:hypothetical protein
MAKAAVNVWRACIKELQQWISDSSVTPDPTRLVTLGLVSDSVKLTCRMMVHRVIAESDREKILVHLSKVKQLLGQSGAEAPLPHAAWKQLVRDIPVSGTRLAHTQWAVTVIRVIKLHCSV